MEEMGGLELVDRWHEIQNGPVAGVFQGSAAVENEFECAPLSQTGSLYFKRDVGPELR